MVKKLFTLVALFALCLVAQAKVVEDVNCDYSTWTEWDMYKMGFKPQIRDGVLWANASVHAWQDANADEGIEAGYSGKTVDWYQFFMLPAFRSESGNVHEGTFKVRGSEPGSFNVHLRWSWGADPVEATVNFTTEWQEVTVTWPEVDGDNIDVILQTSFQGDLEIAWVKIQHEKIERTDEVWNELMVNGDAEGEYGEVPCAYSKEFNRYQREDGMPQNEPYPCDIEDDGTGNKVFVVHAKQVDPNDFAEGAQYYEYPGGNATAAYQWMNQFWIQSPKSWKSGETVKLSFKYKASKNVSADTQCHNQTPGSYMHWSAIGDVNFTTDWQTYEGKFTIPSEANGMWSIAFNLKETDTDVDYYFDDLSWKEQELEEGWFVAGANAKGGLAYDYEKSISMTWNEEEGYYEAVVGTTEDPVHEIQISTKRGSAKAYQANTIKAAGALEFGEWVDYVAQSKAEIRLNGTGVWKVLLDEEYKQFNLEMLSGKLDEKVEIKANPIEIVVAGVERDDIKDDDHPDGTGAAWDNQFWIMANRALSEGEETYVEFEYMGSVEAKTTTQCHKGAGEYLHWAAIGDVNFTTNWQKAEISFTIPSAGDGMQSIAFNMAEIKGACDYHIKNVIWKLADDSESLIDQTGDKNFWWKVSAGTAPVQGDPAGIQNVTVGTKANGAMFNLAGQKVDKNYKGIVIKDGKKFVK